MSELADGFKDSHNMQFAYARFIDDNVKCVVPVQDIKNFDSNKLNPNKKYLVKYTYTDDDSTEYWPATISHVGDILQLYMKERGETQAIIDLKLKQVNSIVAQKIADVRRASKQGNNPSTRSSPDIQNEIRQAESLLADDETEDETQI